ncbi:carboxylesterase/lipase family protein [Gynuella sunshinyii]|uniref:Carboxylic ester hydrolase n=1 Tax=Gynuella sunshinyii YC6258 TaxID=1445510 RepID=A0A0C5VFU4_9GAMM|nr:carboxylesterase family protein [Gynuella sunshinyii]AJQ93066.1 carboxylesterase type B [Gynuella sunshinyii YC6258]
MAANSSVIIETSFGRLRGKNVNDVYCFRKVPYAEPATGPNRFKLPLTPMYWSDVYDAITDGSAPPQPPSGTSAIMGAYPMSQDESCLHLDIWSPSNVNVSKPVLVFIHGGAFITGGGSLSCYDGHALARKAGMVVVNISYRLGPLGFLAQPDLAPPNLGIHDQIAALKWIQKTIGSFGGDSDNITVAGQSAGAYCVAVMLANTSCRGLFNRAILMSPPLGMKLCRAEQAKPLAAAMLRVLGFDPNDVSKLKELPADQLMKALTLLQAQPATSTIPGEFTLPFTPVVDDDLISCDPIDAIKEGAGAWCDTLIGATREEFNAFSFQNPVFMYLTGEQLQKEFERSYGEKGADKLAVARAARVPSTPGQLLADLRGDATFNQPVMEFARAQAKHGAKSYLYQFDWQSPVHELGACHCIDLPFLFGQWDIWQAAPMVNGANKQELRDLSFLFQGALTEFARSGNPNNQGLPLWPEYGADKMQLHFDRRIQYFYKHD